MTWSTTVAGVSTPFRWHSAQSGFWRRNNALALRQRASYPRAFAPPRSASWLYSLRCSSQYTPMSHRLGQPGYRQGLLGLVGISSPQYQESTVVIDGSAAAAVLHGSVHRHDQRDNAVYLFRGFFFVWLDVPGGVSADVDVVEVPP